jgi:hypothetical protein
MRCLGKVPGHRPYGRISETAAKRQRDMVKVKPGQPARVAVEDSLLSRRLPRVDI